MINDKMKPDIIVGLDPSCTLSSDKKKRFGIAIVQAKPFFMLLNTTTFAEAFRICGDINEQCIDAGETVRFFSEYPKTKKNWHGGGSVGSVNVGHGLAAMKLFPDLLESIGCDVVRVYPRDTKICASLFERITGVKTKTGDQDARDAGMISWNAYESIYCDPAEM